MKEENKSKGGENNMANPYRNGSKYGKLFNTAMKLAERKGEYSQQELISITAKNTVQKASRVRFQLEVLRNKAQKSNGGKSEWVGSAEKGKLVALR